MILSWADGRIIAKMMTKAFIMLSEDDTYSFGWQNKSDYDDYNIYAMYRAVRSSFGTHTAE